MCGITGCFDPDRSFDPARFARANNIIRHRGPDDFGYITIGTNCTVRSHSAEDLSDCKDSSISGAFGFRRLAIIDLSKSGNQPMSDKTGRYWIVFNGEIYNYIEIRKQLERLGYDFLTSSDTEVILNAYAAWGKDCLAHFNGMWAFCIFDREAAKLFCSRDRLGIKPFYYVSGKNRFAFASEIKQLLELYPGEYNRVNRRMAFDFLAHGSYGNESMDTYFEGIRKLGAGCWMEVALSDGIHPPEEKSWWDLPSFDPKAAPDERLVYEELLQLLTDSLKLRLRSDVPVGTALSGGLDSSGLVCLLARMHGLDAGANRVFTILSRDPRNDDEHFARHIIGNIPVTPFIQTFEDHARGEELSDFTWHQEEPLQSASIFGSWQLYRFIKENGVTVVMDGQGADELMGGYNRFPFRRFLLDTLRSQGVSGLMDQAGKIGAVHGCSLSHLLIQLLPAQAAETARIWFPARFRQMKADKARPFLHPDLYHSQHAASLEARKYYERDPSLPYSLIKRESRILTRHTNLPGILRQVDRNSMAFSVEARLPFLDYRLVEFLYRLPVRFMIRDGYTKYAYRRSMEGILPDPVRWRRTKVGFRMPEFDVLRGKENFVLEILRHAHEYLNLPRAETEAVRMLSDQHRYHNILWRMVCWSVWISRFNMA